MTGGWARAVGLATVAVGMAVAGCSCSQGITKAEAQRRADGAKRDAVAGFAQLWPAIQDVAPRRFRPNGEFSQCTDQGGDVRFTAQGVLDPPAGSTPASLAAQLEQVLSTAGWQVTPGVGRDTTDEVSVGGKSGDLVAAILVHPDVVFVDVLSPCVGVGTHDEVGHEGTKDLDLP